VKGRKVFQKLTRMDLFRYETYAFRLLHECYAEGFAFALPQFHADAVEYVFLGRAQYYADDVFLALPRYSPDQTTL
jgi:hypothetical protein